VQKQKYIGLEVVRAIAASTVVYGHIFYLGLVPNSELLPLPGQFATEAMMIFFVLSGVVITLSTEKRAKRSAGSALVLAYLKARLLRIVRGRFLIVWIVAATISLVIFYPPGFASGAVSHLVSILSFSIPWKAGHLVANWRLSVPRVPVSFGVACVVIGLVYARCPIAAVHFDIFRLTSFALRCCPLMLANVQDDVRSCASINALLLARIVLAAIALVLLWVLSPSVLSTKLVLAIGAAVAAIMPLAWIDKLLVSMRWSLPSLTYIGSVSYALYAVHVPVISLMAHAFRDWGSAPKLVCVLITLMLSSFFLERVIPLLFSGPRDLAKA
jgi:peptidoglycan/LPS O-acetylase OafA/YrhL